MGKENLGLLLLDSNIALEILLEQDRAGECADFFNLFVHNNIPVVITSFSLHSIEIILCANGLFSRLDDFLVHLGSILQLEVYHTALDEERSVIRTCQEKGLDFDDALHYFVARKLDATLVSFDRHFDKTDITRLEPQDVLARFS